MNIPIFNNGCRFTLLPVPMFVVVARVVSLFAVAVATTAVGALLAAYDRSKCCHRWSWRFIVVDVLFSLASKIPTRSVNGCSPISPNRIAQSSMVVITTSRCHVIPVLGFCAEARGRRTTGDRPYFEVVYGAVCIRFSVPVSPAVFLTSAEKLISFSVCSLFRRRVLVGMGSAKVLAFLFCRCQALGAAEARWGCYVHAYIRWLPIVERDGAKQNDFNRTRAWVRIHKKALYRNTRRTVSITTWLASIERQPASNVIRVRGAQRLYKQLSVNFTKLTLCVTHEHYGKRKWFLHTWATFRVLVYVGMRLN